VPQDNSFSFFGQPNRAIVIVSSDFSPFDVEVSVARTTFRRFLLSDAVLVSLKRRFGFGGVATFDFLLSVVFGIELGVCSQLLFLSEM
jgi:hypothetical protein